MAISFPGSKSNGQKFTSGNKSWTWNGSSWKGSTSSGGDAVTLGGISESSFLRSDADDSTTGKLGIGTSAPQQLLQVKETSTATTSVHYPITVGGSNHAVAYAAGIGFDPEGYGYRNKMAIVTEGNGQGWSRGKFHFLLNGLSTSAEATLADSKLTIQENGTVGIGTTAPGSKLHVSGGYIKAENTGTDAYFFEGIRTGAQTTLRIYDNANNLYIDSHSTMHFRANQTGGSGGNFNFSGGNVGIGTTDPKANFQVIGPATSSVPAAGSGAVGGAIFSADLNTYGMFIGSINSGNGYIQQQRTNTATYYDLMLQPNGGNVGIGTETPRSALQVVSGVSRLAGGSARFGKNDITGGLFLHSDASTASHYNWMITTQDTVNQGFEIIPSSAPGNIEFSTPAFVITGDDRNVGIGTSGPGEKLHVEGNIRASGNIGVTQTDGDYLAKLYQTSADGFLELYTGEATPVSRVKLSAYGDSYIAPSTTSGNLGIGDTTPSYKLDVNGDIRATGDVITDSDIRFKSNVRPISKALSTVCALSGKIYSKDDKDDQIGLIAQDVEKILPQMVHTASDEIGTKSVNYQNMVAILIEAIKEQQEQIDKMTKMLESK